MREIVLVWNIRHRELRPEPEDKADADRLDSRIRVILYDDGEVGRFCELSVAAGMPIVPAFAASPLRRQLA
jgi:hypothetical protein